VNENEFDGDVDLTAYPDCPPPFRDGKVHVLSEKCSTCVFDGHMHLRKGRLAGMVRESIEEDSAITCHQTLPYGDYDVPGQALCRGFADLHGDKVTPIRLARGMGIIEEQAPPTHKKDRS
jgi:hypothetical protein